jgi:hypothetical protein
MLDLDNRRPRKILTTEGEITINRYILRPVDEQSRKKLNDDFHIKGVVPIDEYLGIDRLPFKVTCDMALRIAKIAIKEPSYKDAEVRMKEDFGITISDDRIRDITNFIGGIVDTEDERITRDTIADYDTSQVKAGHRRGRPPADAFTLYLETDGAMFNTRGKNKEGSSWKENKLALAFRSDKLITGTDKEGKPVKRLGEREYISTTAGVEKLRERFLALAIRNGLLDAYNVVILSDGAPWIRNTRKQYFPFAVHILDLCHLKENVTKFAQYYFKNDVSQYKPWAEKVNNLLEEGKWNDVLQLEEVSPYKSKDTPGGIVNLYSYIYNNSDMLDYPTFRSKGYFVGSGAIESGNKTVMQSRVKQAGMRWVVSNAQVILSLRAKLESGLWDQFVVPLVKRSYFKVFAE